MSSAVCRVSPNLALVKYWGKLGRGRNRPATPSLGLALGGLETVTVARIAEGREDRLTIDGRPDEGGRIRSFFDEARSLLRTEHRFEVRSRNSFPVAAGLASSSSGFAALALSLARLCGRDGDGRLVAELARRGSASAARALHGGLSYFPAGAKSATQLLTPEDWPELRVVVAIVTRAPKPWSSREAMADTVTTSPYYRAWLRHAGRHSRDALAACRARDLEALGRVMLLSYSRMHAALMASNPPKIYWNPTTLTLLEACAALRASGVAAFETVDAGPQVKVLCHERDAQQVLGQLSVSAPDVELFVTGPGAGPRLSELGAGEQDPLPAEDAL